ncbi:hypothetical protein [Thermococcus pacificus]|uniref:Uncharacterized protein n=1 Tax=Thermococcus pacificus TaxID=71998 RepID=A0A218P965_9EURY|nr:hypothetical protein [Thermococcus pacificus]ASJ07335.1 hypothetical protein A3L08_08375 [Thermococcus pacificus]
MPRKVLALFLLGVLFFAGVAVALNGKEPEAITRDPLVHDENTYAPTEDGSLYCWISGYASQSQPGYLYNIYGNAGSTGVCDLWTKKFSPSTATPTGRIRLGLCPGGRHRLVPLLAQDHLRRDNLGSGNYLYKHG